MTCRLLITYRLLAALVILLPLVINLIVKGDIVWSFIYAPIFTMLAFILAVYLDDKIVESLQGTTDHFTKHTAAKTPIRKINQPLITRFKSEHCCIK
ncbi:hypothetical protein [Pseudoalteromonas sp.]|uniref:hypothetical protein n=1 Tax=Pseudoalteromonas sp. TaxID=53249 RepID=UPI0035682865